MAFTRTPAGLAEKWRFHSVPTIWVEGPTDIFFYEPMLGNLSYRLEAFHGSRNSKALIDALVKHNYPYVVILDGDYSTLKPRRSPHRSVVILARYSFENYLWEAKPVNRACLRHACCGDEKDLVIGEMERVEKHLQRELILAVSMDIAAREIPSAPTVLPEKIEPLLCNQVDVSVNATRVSAITSRAQSQLTRTVIRSAKGKVKAFLRQRAFMHLLKGHMVLGVLRRIFVTAATKEKGSGAQISNDILTQLLAEMIWRGCDSSDHKKLKKKVRARVRELYQQYPATTPTASSESASGSQKESGVFP
jgi:hypothetical protein